MTTLPDLLGRGYFPRELPPLFTTNDFASKVVSNRSSLPSSFTSNSRIAKVTCHNLARAGTLRRKLGIPNPILHFNLCCVIEQNWSQINAHFQQSTFSRSIPIPGSTIGRALLPLHNFDLSAFRAHTRATARFILKADISRCYQSIYSHSIPWAIHGKLFAKNHRQLSHLGNNLDRWIRNGQDGQTIGIPIGPDTSLAIAEIILCAADLSLANKLPGIRGLRSIDDYEFGFAEYSKAEAGLSAIQETLSEYELELNPRKTKIIELPVPLEYPWVPELATFSFRTTPKGQKTDLIRFFDRAFELIKDNPEEHVLKYAIPCLRSVQIDVQNWGLFQHLLMQCINVEPGTFYSVLEQLLRYHQLGWSLDLASLERVMNDQIIHHAPLSHGSEVAWAVWSCMLFNVSIGVQAAAALSMMEDSIVALLSLDANQRGLIQGGLNLNIWQSYMEQQELYGEQWLLSYEANVKGWLPSNSGIDHVSADSNFGFLKTHNVQFYDVNRVLGIVPTGAAPSTGIAPSFSLSY